MVLRRARAPLQLADDSRCNICLTIVTCESGCVPIHNQAVPVFAHEEFLNNSIFCYTAACIAHLLGLCTARNVHGHGP